MIYNILLLLMFFNFLINEEIITFNSFNPFSFKDIITNLENQEEQKVYGILNFPNNNLDKKHPLIIGVAGSDGWSEHHQDYLKMYRDMGIATFELKSFDSRDVVSTVGTQIDVTMAMMVLDSYMALNVLSNDSRIDKNKVAITGWSLGGGVALFSGWEKLIKAIKPNARFSAHLPIYPPCFIRVDELKFTNAPIHILIGELDDWTPSDACVELVSDLKKSNHNIDITIYEDSHHSFDSLEDLRIIEHGYSFKNCMFDISDDGAVLMNYLNFEMTSPLLQKIGLYFCVERGPTAGGNPISREKAFKSSESFISKHLLNE